MTVLPSAEKIGTELRRAHRRWMAHRYRGAVAARTQQIHGSLGRMAANDLVVVALMRDAEGHVGPFIRHHLNLGARHVVLMDNGSVDASIDVARQFEQAIVLRCDAPYATHKYAMKQFLCERFARGCWCLIADMDERFEYPYSVDVRLADFLSYLNDGGFSAVLAPMLDLFADGPPADWPDAGEELEQRSCWYDASAIDCRPYRPHRTNRCAARNMLRWSGGIRRSAFAMQGNPSLTKHPLLFPDRGAVTSFKSSHECRHAHVADVTCLLKHYKFDRCFVDRCRVAVERGNYFNKSCEYVEYLRALQQDPHLFLRRSTARTYVSVENLMERGLLYVSPAYRGFCQSKAIGGATVDRGAA